MIQWNFCNSRFCYSLITIIHYFSGSQPTFGDISQNLFLKNYFASGFMTFDPTPQGFITDHIPLNHDL